MITEDLYNLNVSLKVGSTGIISVEQHLHGTITDQCKDGVVQKVCNVIVVKSFGPPPNPQTC